MKKKYIFLFTIVILIASTFFALNSSSKPIKDINERELKQVFSYSKKYLIVLTFYADYCSACKKFLPVLKSVNRKSNRILIARMNVDKNRKLSSKLASSGIPTTYLIKNNKVVDGFVGAVSEKTLLSILKKHVNFKTKVKTKRKKKRKKKKRKSSNKNYNKDSSSDSDNVSSPSNDVSKVISLINDLRRKNGARPLKMTSKMNYVAQAHAEDMAANKYFSHSSLDGRSPFNRLTNAGVKYMAAAENIGDAFSPKSVVNMWMNSPGHRTNMLNPNYSRCGIGYKRYSNTNIYYVIVFAN